MVENEEIECYIHSKREKLNKLSWQDIKNWDTILDLSDSIVDFIENDSAIAVVSCNRISFKAIASGNDNSGKSNSKSNLTITNDTSINICQNDKNKRGKKNDNSNVANMEISCN